MAKILKCDDCASIIQVLAEGDEKVCSDHMFEFPLQTEGEKAPKHKPVVEIDGDKVTVKVGEAAHPMDDDHYIQFVIVELVMNNTQNALHLEMLQKQPLL